MSDTRAAIRELRTLSERRSRSALTEPEAARWVALRRQLGLPPEPANVDLSTPPAPPADETPQAVAASPAPAAAPLASPPAPVAAGPTPAGAPAWENAPDPEPTGTPATREADPWAGPSLDSPAAPASSPWVGPALDAPAWSDAAAERPTDPGLDEPPPAPFDAAPAARPQQETRAVDLGGSPDEPVQLAAAAEFISYSRQGNETIELPPDAGAADSFQPQGLAELAGAAEPAGAVSGAAAPDVLAEDAVPPMPAPLPPDVLAASPEGAGTSLLTGAPLPLQAFAPDAPADNGGALPLTPAPLPLQAFPPDAAADDGGVLPLTPGPLPAFSPDASAEDGGVLAVPPVPLPLEAVVDDGPEAPQGFQEVGFVAPAPDERPAVLAPSGDTPEAPAPSPVSTWAPGASEPPVLGAEQFARTGGPLGNSGLDPWPEAPSAEAPAEDVVETVGDEDLVEELSTPEPLPPFPVSPPPGSGGIRGFQFPKPPPAPVPTPPTPPNWQRTEPGVPAFVSDAALRTPRSSPGAVAASSPEVPKPVPAPVAPREVPRASPTASPAAFARSTPLPLQRPAQPVSATARAPATPAPRAPERAAPPRTSTPVATPRAPQLMANGAAPGRSLTPEPRKAVPAPPRTPPALQPLAGNEETALPLLELVDELEPPRPVPPERARPTPTPPVGTQGMFGPPMMLNPSFVDGEHRVVIHTLEGQVHRGTVHDLDLHDDVLPVQQQDGRTVRIPTQRLKAVFFVLAPGAKHPPTRGERVQVTFRDGRQVVGYSEDHAGREAGFFVVPSDARTNTARVYVYRGGVQSITTG